MKEFEFEFFLMVKEVFVGDDLKVKLLLWNDGNIVENVLRKYER